MVNNHILAQNKRGFNLTASGYYYTQTRHLIIRQQD